ncbi:unnamed protein product [Brassica oleracea var. botrytis]
MKLYHFALRIGPYDDDYVCVSARRNLGKERNMLKVETRAVQYGKTEPNRTEIDNMVWI